MFKLFIEWGLNQGSLLTGEDTSGVYQSPVGTGMQLDFCPETTKWQDITEPTQSNVLDDKDVLVSSGPCYRCVRL